MIHLFLTGCADRHINNDETVGCFAKENGLSAEFDILRYRQHNTTGVVVSNLDGSEGVFGDRLKKAREARSLNQTELAKLAKLQPAAIGHFEKDRRKPSFANIRALSKALGVSSDYLLGRATEMSGATTAFRNEENLSTSDRDAIQHMINTLAQSRKDGERG